MTTSASTRPPSANESSTPSAWTSTDVHSLPSRIAASGTAAQQGGEQVGAVDGVGPFAVEALARPGEALGREDPPVRPPPELPAGLQRDRPLEELVHDAQPPQEPHEVGRRHQPGAHLLQRGRLLVDGDAQARAMQERGGRQAADAGTDDRDAGLSRRRHCAP